MEREQSHGALYAIRGFLLSCPPLSPIRFPACGFRLVNSRSKADVELAPDRTTTSKVSHGYKVYLKT